MIKEKISVLMGIYNCEDTLEEAVSCIIAQTYQNWELIMCDDGSSDNTYRIAQKLKEQDERIVLLKNESNQGLNKTLNRCLKVSTGEIVARMDGDDRCVPERFEKQISFLKKQNKYKIVSSKMTFFDENGIWGENNVKSLPSKYDVLTGSPICHAPVMMWKECMIKVNGYTDDIHMLRVEDVNLWIKLYAKGYYCYNMQEALYSMRNDRAAAQRRKYCYRINETYARWQGCHMMKVPVKYYLWGAKPLIVGLVPSKLRVLIRRKQAKKRNLKKY